MRLFNESLETNSIKYHILPKSGTSSLPTKLKINTSPTYSSFWKFLLPITSHRKFMRKSYRNWASISTE